MQKILVIDGSSIIHRAFYGMRLLQTQSGKYTNAVYGTVSIIKRQLDALSPDYAAVAFDLHGPTFRHEKYAEYKSGRRPTPPELVAQMEDTKNCLRYMGLHVLELPGWEADDIQGTVARMAADLPDAHAYILSGDRDLLQLIDDRTTVLLAANHETEAYDSDAFFGRFGIRPEQYVDAKALMGDASDHIPGVPGIGEKTALKLISLFGSLDGVYEALRCVDGLEGEARKALSDGVCRKLTEGRAFALLSRDLARIRCDAPIGKGPQDLRTAPVDNDALYRLFVELEFRAFLTKFRLTPPAAADETKAARAKEAAADGAGRVPAEDRGTLPAEGRSAAPDRKKTAAKPYEGGKTIGKRAFVHPVLSDTLPADLPRRIAVAEAADGLHLYAPEMGEIIQNGQNDALPPVFDAGFSIICYDSKSFWHRLRAAGITPRAEMRDVMLAGYLWRGGDGSIAPDALTLALLGATEEEVGQGLAARLWQLEEALEERLAADGMLALAREVEWPLATLLAEMEETGFQIDRDGMRDYGRELSATMAALCERIYVEAGHPFNVQSTKQLAAVLFEEMGLPALKKTKNGYSTDAETLEKLRGAHPIIEDILDYRQAAKLYATYAVGLVEAADGNDRIHTDFKQALTATGRLSSAEPNLQNIPVRTEMGKRMRRYFVTKPGWVLVDADYSQIELRLLAHLSGDEQMIGAFLAGADIHASTAASVFGVPLSAVTPEMRKRAKAINFGIIYGMGAHSLSQDLHIPQKQAKAYIDQYFATFPKIGAYLEGTAEAAAEAGFCTTMYGRRRYIPQLKSVKAVERALGRRLALNSPIQGTAADLMKMAMIRVRDALAREVPQARLVMQVHDELIVETPRERAEETAAVLRREMEETASLSVPLSASAGIGENWLEAKD